MKFYQNLNDCLFFEPYPSDINNLSIPVLLELYHGCVCVCVHINDPESAPVWKYFPILHNRDIVGTTVYTGL